MIVGDYMPFSINYESGPDALTKVVAGSDAHHGRTDPGIDIHDQLLCSIGL